ncbi:oxidoreductase NAD-binding domain protein, partial [Vibrio parahaemolyticus V-223/04]
ALKRRFTTIS